MIRTYRLCEAMRVEAHRGSKQNLIMVSKEIDIGNKQDRTKQEVNLVEGEDAVLVGVTMNHVGEWVNLIV